MDTISTMKNIIELSLNSDAQNYIFADGNNYIIPIYQRGFEWGANEIDKLMEDIESIATNEYYIGSLVVAQRENGDYEVIDGQQRLTALYLIKCALGEKPKSVPSYECRDKARDILCNLDDASIVEKYKENNLVIMYRYLLKKLAVLNCENQHSKVNSQQKFIDNLNKVVLFRIIVPQDTDLNRYFETMNTRGEQLEPQDIIKAKLMSCLSEEIQKQLFAEIWDACSREGYCQMNFGTTTRTIIFGNQWQNMPKTFNVILKDYEKAKEEGEKNTTNEVNKTTSLTISQIIAKEEKELGKVQDEIDENYKNVRFEDIINFPNFLMHILRIVVNDPQKNIKLGEQLDDKNLIDEFTTVLDSCKSNEGGNAKFAINFCSTLLQCRYLFDKYFIKRESKDGEENWSLKQLKTTDGNNKKAYYVNTFDDKLQDYNQDDNLMLQACFRVSYTSPKVMHWITDLLQCLYENTNSEDKQQKKENNIQNNLFVKLEEIAKTNINEICGVSKLNNESAHSDDKQIADPCQGVNTHHFLFNYLDFLLWRKEKSKYGDFKFEYRNSVEHWHSQNPENKDGWSRSVLDSFGNLCLLNASENSKFSNLDPEAKATQYAKNINKGSIKLRLMRDLTNENNGNGWTVDKCQQHAEEMLATLQYNVISKN